MSFYDDLPSEVLILFYNEVVIKILKTVDPKNHYYCELELILAAASKRGLNLEKKHIGKCC
ncbi:hypothetical protein [Niallia sp. BSM11]|uniref:hypothetical protein n=1 Tax=Niallia sp. BSM11 TaxID=3391576 RepID=UPI0039856620